MAKKKAKSGKRMSESLAVEILRKNWQRLMEADGVTSCGVGYRQKDGKKTDEICIQCTVRRKYDLETLAKKEMKPLPETVEDEAGNRITVDVLQREYKLAHELEVSEREEEEIDFHEMRRSRLDPIAPGASVSHVDGTAGTIGAIVYDKESGQPLILSNWHVLHRAGGDIGDDIVQPGPFDDSETFLNHCGQLVRSHLGLAGDCAVASIEGRDWEEAIIELGVTPRRMARPNLDDLVVKSGRTTGVTYGVVERVNVVANLGYGGSVGVKAIGGFEIRPNPDKLPSNGEISMGGDSGSVWMLDTDNEADADIVLGLHFAGETDPDPDEEHALACMITSVASKLDIAFEPPEEAVDSEAALWREVLARLEALEASRAATKAEPTCRCCEQTATGTPGEIAVAPEDGIPVHGNWCGPGHGGGAPTDSLDEACMHHDNCYGREGYFSCDCDGELVRELDRLLRRGGLSPHVRAKAFVIRQYFAHAPCTRYVRVGGRRIPIPVSSPPTAAFRSAGRRLDRSVRDVGRHLGRRFGW